MTIAEASALLETLELSGNTPTIWADLGAGSGTFTLALATWLKPGSMIHAVDTNEAALRNIPTEYNRVRIETQVADFVSADLPFRQLNGLLVANALHYVRDKVALLKKWEGYLGAGGYILIVEYDTDQAVPHWVPYPISLSNLEKLTRSLGWQTFRRLHRTSSMYKSGDLYTVLINL